MVYQIYPSRVEYLTNFKGVWLDYLLRILAYHSFPQLLFIFFKNTNLNYKIGHTCSALVVKSLYVEKSVIVYLTELVIVILRCVIIVKAFF